MRPADLTVPLVQDHTAPETFGRGEDYYFEGAVLSVIRRGGWLQAEVAGSDFAPYKVRVSFEAAGDVEASCNCPYDWGGWCKHVVAVLLTCIRRPEAVTELPALEESLSDLDRGQLQALLLRLVERDPSLADVIEGEVALSNPSDAPPVDAIRRGVRSELGASATGYPGAYSGGYGGGDADGSRRFLDGAWESVRAGDARSALTVLEAITDEYMDSWETIDWEMLEDYGGEVLDFLADLGTAWTEALLSVDDLTPDEREDYGAKLDVWAGELADYVAGGTFDAAFRAVEQGWSYPPLVRVLDGEVPDDDFFEELSHGPLTTARLNVLERRGRTGEYLRLSEAADATVGHAVALVGLGRIQDAVEYGLRRLAAPEEALTVAEALHGRGETGAALRIGERGLSLEGRKGRLAVRVRELAGSEGNTGLALQAAVAAFREDPDLDSYRRALDLAGGRRAEYRGKLLEGLRRSMPFSPSGPVEVFLHEGLINDAIAVVGQRPVGSAVARVADAAIDSRPGWVISTGQGLAEGIMDEGASKRYAEAAGWLARARDAYLADDRAEEWQAYLDDLIDRHRRKYKLRPMLEVLAV